MPNVSLRNLMPCITNSGFQALSLSLPPLASDEVVIRAMEALTMIEVCHLDAYDDHALLVWLFTDLKT